MFEPDNRQMLRDLLRPPSGYRMDRAISTSFSLDLSMLITLPVAFTMFDRSVTGENHEPDPLALLQAIRQYAGRMHFFCQAGRISVPDRHHLLFAHLEDSITEVTSPKENGVFHPKLVLLRFIGDTQSLPEDHPDFEKRRTEVRYRLLCSSRNLTFDKSWDTMLALDGTVSLQNRPIREQNQPLARFVKSLPDLAIRSVRAKTKDRCRAMADELLQVEFELPDGFEGLKFWPIGSDDQPRRPFPDDADRWLIISPFLSDELLQQFRAKRGRQILVSRPEAMDEIPWNTLQPFENFYLHDAAEEPTLPLETEGTSENTGENGNELPDATAEELSGLHAKVFVADRGPHTHIWTGSANATNAAFTQNVEFLVELRGPRYKFGVNKLIRPEHKRDTDDRSAVHFDDLLEKYRPPDEQPEINENAREAEELANRMQRTLAHAGFGLQVELNGDMDDERDQKQETYRLIMTGSRLNDSLYQNNAPHMDRQITVYCRPVGLQPHERVKLDPDAAEPVAVFPSVTLQAVTSFMVFYIEARVGRALCKTSFVLNLPMHGNPANRHQRLLTLLLENREKLIRYLLMLLSDDSHDLRVMSELVNRAGAELADPEGQHPESGLPLLEPILKTLEQSPDKLDQVNRLVEDLSDNENGRDLLPPGFTEMWKSIWEVRKEVRP